MEGRERLEASEGESSTRSRSTPMEGRERLRGGAILSGSMLTRGEGATWKLESIGPRSPTSRHGVEGVGIACAPDTNIATRAKHNNAELS